LSTDLTRNAVQVLPEGELERKLALGRPLRVKLGIDVTAPHIHIGNGIPLQRMRAFQDAGHTGVLIVGDYTARIGDPSGASAERPLIPPEEIDRMAATFFESAYTILDPARTEVRYNGEWLAKVDFAEVLRLTRAITVARLLERDDFANRFAGQQAISVSELLYPLMQAYDSVAIEADVELGGTDQLYNLLTGRDVMEAYGLEPQLVLTTPLIESWDGTKMSGSKGNYIALVEDPNEQFGKTMRLPDEMLADYYRLVMEQELPTGDPMQAKLALARFIVARAHGPEAAEEAEQVLHARRARAPGRPSSRTWPSPRIPSIFRLPGERLGDSIEPLAPRDRPGRGEARRPAGRGLRSRPRRRRRRRAPGREAAFHAVDARLRAAIIPRLPDRAA
jgi:tyrosyl-tRNA synthetase